MVSVLLGGGHIYMIGFHQHLILHLCYHHLGMPLNQFGQEADIRRVEMRDEHEGDSALGRHGCEECFEGFQPPG